VPQSTSAFAWVAIRFVWRTLRSVLTATRKHRGRRLRRKDEPTLSRNQSRSHRLCRRPVSDLCSRRPAGLFCRSDVHQTDRAPFRKPSPARRRYQMGLRPQCQPNLNISLWILVTKWPTSAFTARTACRSTTGSSMWVSIIASVCLASCSQPTWAGTNRRTRAFVSGRAQLAISDCTEIGSSLHQGDTRWRLCGSTGSGARPPASSR
jgi:hypothetical protein